MPNTRHHLLNQLPEGERSARLVQQLEAMDAYDLFDVLAELGYGIQPMTRDERASAFSYKQVQWLNTLPETAARTLQAIAAQFASAGTEGLENPQMFNLPVVRNAGGIRALQNLGKSATEIILDVKRKMFAA